MEEEYIELVPEGLTRGVSLQEAYFLMLRDKKGQRFLPALLDKEEYEQLFLALQKKQYPSTRLMNRLAHRYNITLESVHVFYPPHGNLSASLIFNNQVTTERVACNLADGITAALDNHSPILMQRSMFEEQILRQKGEGQVSMPITAMNKKLLEEAMKAAVEEDNFELASVLRDEIKLREALSDPDTSSEE